MNLKGSIKHEDESTAHPPYSPDLEPSDFHLFGPLKDALGCCFVDDDELKRVHEELWCFSKEVYMTGHLRQSGKSVFIMNKSLWKNKLNFVKDVPMVYVNLIITVILVSEKK